MGSLAFGDQELHAGPGRGRCILQKAMELREYPDVGSLSSPLDRLLAKLVDWALEGVFVLVFLLGGFSWVSGVVLQAMSTGKPPGPEAMPKGPQLSLLLGCLGALLLLAVVQCWGLAVRGQTIGKRLIGIQIVDMDDRPAGFLRALLLRTFVFGALLGLVQGWTGPVGVLLPLLDVLPVLLGDRRCLHDYVAGTRVRDTSVAHGKGVPVLAAFGALALGMGLLLSKVGVDLHVDELKQLAARPGVLPESVREPLGVFGPSEDEKKAAARPGPKDDVSLSPRNGSAMYRYEDDSGAVQFSGDLDSIPKKYRARARPIE